ncbi:DsbA family protein, partial [Pseudomonadota bacterium]
RTVKNILLTIMTVSLLLFSFSAWSASTKEEIQELSTKVDAMQKDLAEIKTMLKDIKSAPAPRAAGPAFKEQVVSIGSSPVKGQANAIVTLMEFSDYQCPFCARHYRDVMPTLQAEYIDTGKVKFVMREKPIPSLHRNAMNASMAALCAGDQGKYWEMHNLLFDNQKELGDENLKAFAGTLGLDTSKFNECLDGKKHNEQISEDIRLSDKLGMSGTPGFIVGLTDQNDPDKALMSEYIKGAKSLDSFKAAIDELLESAK